MREFSADVGTSLLNSLPTLVTGNTALITATHGEAKQLPPGSMQLTSDGSPIQTRPPIDWMPIILVSGGLIVLSILLSRRS